ncbi:MAG: SH3 domain-containing protein, partial [Cyclobacteriaceae bacterium]
AWFGTKYPESDVVRATHKNESEARYWHTYTEQQLLALNEISRQIVDKYKLTEILGHDDISPGRKQDPGPAFDMNRFRRNILGENRESGEDVSLGPLPEKGKVIASKLNIREGAGSGFGKVAQPLPRGKDVKILSEHNGWYQVETTITGWVSKGFIDTEEA